MPNLKLNEIEELIDEEEGNLTETETVKFEKKRKHDQFKKIKRKMGAKRLSTESEKDKTHVEEE